MLVNAQNNSNNNQQESSSNDCIEIKDNNSIQLPLVKKVTSTTIPSNITQDLKDKVNKLIEIFKRTRNISPDPHNTQEFKSQLLNVYKDTLRLNQDLKSQLFNYISDSVDKNKDALFRMCRRMKNKEDTKTTSTTNNNNTNNSNNNKQQQQQQHQSRIVNQTNPITHSLPIQRSQSNLASPSPSPSKSQPQLTGPVMPINSFEELDQELQSKLNELIRKYQNFKQQIKTDNLLKVFFDNSQIRNTIYMVQNRLLGLKAIRPNIKEFVISYLAKEFGVGRDEFQKRFDLTISMIRSTNILAKNITELRKEIDLLMPNNIANYEQEYERYLKLKKMDESGNMNSLPNNPNDQNKKKPSLPRKRFTWNEKLRDLFKQICLTKINLIKLNGQNVNINDENTLREFFQNDLIPLWPEAWMQMNVLILKYQQLIIQSQQQTQQMPHQNASSSQNQPINTNNINRNTNNINTNVSNRTSSAPSTPVALTNKITNSNNIQNDVINISSKNGRSVLIEPHQSNKPSNLVSPSINRVNQQQFQQQPQQQQQYQQQRPIQNKVVSQPSLTNMQSNSNNNINSTNNNNNNNRQNIIDKVELNGLNQNPIMRRQNSSSGQLNNLNKSVSSSNLNQMGSNNNNNGINNTKSPANPVMRSQQQLQQQQQQQQHHINQFKLAELNKIPNLQYNQAELQELLIRHALNKGAINGNNNSFGTNN